MDLTFLSQSPALWALALLVLVGLVLAGWLIAGARQRRLEWRLGQWMEAQQRQLQGVHEDLIESQREVRDDLARAVAALRMEARQHEDGLRQHLLHDAALTREEHAASLQRFASQFGQQLQQLTDSNERRMVDMRHTLEARLQSLQAENGVKLDEMRRLVDEKLHATLEQRLGESFRLVSQQLESVHQGLGHMRELAAGVGDLQRVLVNVKSRGTWGEVQLARLIQDVLTPEQYAFQVKPIPGQNEVVECAIRLPGRGPDAPVWLPIDAKFPREAFERLQEAQERADEAAVRAAGLALERAIEIEAKRIASKYVAPPHTTDFAILFLATESLYAEVLRRPGLFERLQAQRITLTGPSTLAAMLNSLQMGFRTLAIEQRSSEVWQVLRGVKTEFDKFGVALAQVRKSLESASQRIGQTETRTRVMLRNLKRVEALPETEPPSWSAELEADEFPDEETDMSQEKA